jgi:hypothetical protein
MRQKGWLSILSILVAATVGAQDKPDFSGRWILEPSTDVGPDVARSLTVRQPVVRTNVFGAPMPPLFKELSVERQFVTDVRTETYQIGVVGGTVGGVVPTNRAPAPNVNASETRLWVRWENDRIVIDTGNYSGSSRETGPYSEHSEIWQLEAAGRLILSITDRGSGIASTTKTLTYRKN